MLPSRRARSGRTVALASGVLLVLLLATVAVFWQDIRVAWIVRELHRDPGRLVDVIEAASNGSEAHRRGVERYVRSEEGARVFVVRYIEVARAVLDEKLTVLPTPQRRSLIPRIRKTLFWSHHGRFVIDVFDGADNGLFSSRGRITNEERRRYFLATTPFLSRLRGREIESGEWIVRAIEVSALDEWVGRVYSGDEDGDRDYALHHAPPDAFAPSEGYALLLTRIEEKSEPDRPE